MTIVVWLSSRQLLVPIADYRWQLPAGYWLNGLSSDGARVLTSPRGNSFRAIRDVDRDISINHAATGSVIERVAIPVIKDEIFHLQFSPDNRFVILAQETQQLLYHIESKQFFRFDSFPRNADGTFHMIYDRLTYWSPDNKLVAIKTPKGLVLWDTHRLKTIAKLPVKSVHTIFERFPEMWFSPQGSSLLTLDRESTLTIWDTATGAKRASLDIPNLMGWKSETYNPSCRFLDDQTALIQLATRQPFERRWQDHFLVVELQKGEVVDELHIDGIMQHTGSITDEEKPANVCIMHGDQPIWRRVFKPNEMGGAVQVYHIEGNRFSKRQDAIQQVLTQNAGAPSKTGRYLHDEAVHHNGKMHQLVDCTTGQITPLNPVGNHTYTYDFSKTDQWLKIKDRYIIDEPLWNKLVDSIKFIKLPRMSTTHHKLDLWSLPAQQHLISLILPEGSHEFLNEAGTRLVVQQGNAVRVYDLPARDGRWWFMGLCAIAAICSVYLMVGCFMRSSNSAPVNDIPPSPSHQG